MKTKNVLQSKTVWGALLMLLPTIFKLLGIEISQEEIDLLGQNINTIIDLLILVIGFVMTIVGRWNATKPLSLN